MQLRDRHEDKAIYGGDSRRNEAETTEFSPTTAAAPTAVAPTDSSNTPTTVPPSAPAWDAPLHVAGGGCARMANGDPPPACPPMLPVGLGQRVRWTVVVLAQRRPRALARLLRSIARANISGTDVGLRIEVDGLPSVSTVQAASRSALDSLMPTIPQLARMHSARDEVIALATAAAKGWQGGGAARVRVSDDIRGLRHGWIAAYCPSHASDYAIILEDDTEVGEDFLQYAVEAMPSAAARASIGGSGTGLASLSLSPRTLDGVTGKRIDSGVPRGGQREQHMSPHVSTWGVVPIPEVWVGFVKWYSDQDMSARCPELLPGAQGLKLTDWYSSDLADGRESSMWSLHWTVFIADVADVQ